MTWLKGRPPTSAILPLPYLAVKVGFRRQVPPASTKRLSSESNKSQWYIHDKFFWRKLTWPESVTEETLFEEDVVSADVILLDSPTGWTMEFGGSSAIPAALRLVASSFWMARTDSHLKRSFSAFSRASEDCERQDWTCASYSAFHVSTKSLVVLEVVSAVFTGCWSSLLLFSVEASAAAGGGGGGEGSVVKAWSNADCPEITFQFILFYFLWK